MNVADRELELDAQPVHLRQAGPLRAAQPVVLYVHGLPGDGADWLPLLERTGGLAPDLLGFGRSGKGGHLDYTPSGLAGFLGRLLEHLEIPRCHLVAHGWGIPVARCLAAERPGQVDRAVLFSPPAPTPLARWLARPLAGELLMGSSTRWLLRRWYRQGAAGAEAFPEDHLQAVWRNFDQGTQRAILRVLRSAPDLGSGAEAVPETTAAWPAAVPRLVLEGELDPWRAPGGDGGGERVAFPTGHWPWLHPAAAERAIDFLTRPD